MNTETNFPTTPVYQSQPNDDEIDISELFSKVWGRRWFMVAFVFIVGALVAGGFAANLLSSPPEKRFSSIVQFSFPTASSGTYPGGQRFAYNDLVSAKVLEQVYRQNGLAEKNISFEDFIAALSINPFAENAEFIKKKYQALLADKKLTRPEIEALEKAYLDEINASQSRFVRISYLESSLTGIDPLLAQKLLQDIPKVWSKYAVEELGVLDLKVAGADFYQANKVERFEFVQILEYMQESAKVLAAALEVLVSDEIGGLVRNRVSGVTAKDLQIRLNNLVDFEINPLFSTVTNLGITRNSQKAMIYLRNTIQDLEDNKAVLSKKSENFARVVNQYTGIDISKPATKADGSAGGFAQYDASFLDKFTSLIEEKSDKAYLQKMLDEQLDVLQQIEEIGGQVVKFKRAEQKLLSKDKEATVEITESVVEDIGVAKDNFESLVSEYKILLGIRNQQVLGNSDALYELTSDDVLVESSLMDRIKKLIVASVLAAIVALMLAVLIALVRKSPQSVGQ